MPEEWKWPFDDLLEEWFEDVADRHKHPRENAGDDYEPMTRNELARDKRN